MVSGLEAQFRVAFLGRETHNRQSLRLSPLANPNPLQGWQLDIQH